MLSQFEARWACLGSSAERCSRDAASTAAACPGQVALFRRSSYFAAAGIA
jgi:hypothetical protein